MHISFFDRYLDREKYKFHIFADPRTDGFTIGNTVLQANRFIELNSSVFPMENFGLTQRGARASEAAWVTHSSFLQEAFLHGKRNQRYDHREIQAWETFSYVGYPSDNFLSQLGIEKKFVITLQGQRRTCQLYEMTFCAKRDLISHYAFHDLHLEFKFFIGNMFDISDTTSRYGNDRDDKIKPSNTIEINYHLDLADNTGAENHETFVQSLKAKFPPKYQMQDQYHLLSDIALNNLSDVVASRQISSFCSDQEYKFVKKEAKHGQFQRRDFFRSTNAELIARFFQTELTKRPELGPLSQDHPVSPTKIPRPLCYFFFSRNGRRCNRGESCRFSHDRQSQLSSLRL